MWESLSSLLQHHGLIINLKNSSMIPSRISLTILGQGLTHSLQSCPWAHYRNYCILLTFGDPQKSQHGSAFSFWEIWSLMWRLYSGHFLTSEFYRSPGDLELFATPPGMCSTPEYEVVAVKQKVISGYLKKIIKPQNIHNNVRNQHVSLGCPNEEPFLSSKWLLLGLA